MSALRSKPARLAVAGGTPVRSAPFPAWPVWEAREERALLEVLRSGRWGSHAGGGRVQDFCERFATVQGVRHAVAVSNGTAALEVALRAVGVAPLDEVILPPYTFVASATAVLSLGAIPVFCDVLPHTYLIDPADAARKVTGRTRAILPVHLAGQPCDMDAVMEVARRHNLKVVEDAAQAPGATWRGRGVGAIGHAGAISFQSSKNLTSGEGGAVVTDDPQVAERAWSIANVGRVPSGAWYQHEVMGSNFRLTEFQGALLLAQLERFPQQFRRRESAARYLDRELAGIPGITPQARDEGVTDHAHHLYLFRYDRSHFGGKGRGWFTEAMRAEGIPCSPGYTTPLYRMKAVVDERRRWAELARAAGKDVRCPRSPDEEALPVAERACSEEGVWLPQQVLLADEADLKDVVEAVRKVQQVASRG